MHDLTGFQRDLLYVVARLGDPKGVAIKDELEQYYDATIDRGRLYPNLDTLVEEGLVDKERTDYRTNVYTLTPRGRDELEARRDWKDRYIDG
jgi:DNA-binding PadR family transcriptional regulator